MVCTYKWTYVFNTYMAIETSLWEMELKDKFHLDAKVLKSNSIILIVHIL